MAKINKTHFKFSFLFNLLALLVILLCTLAACGSSGLSAKDATFTLATGRDENAGTDLTFMIEYDNNTNTFTFMSKGELKGCYTDIILSRTYTSKFNKTGSDELPGLGDLSIAYEHRGTKWNYYYFGFVSTTAAIEYGDLNKDVERTYLINELPKKINKFNYIQTVVTSIRDEENQVTCFAWDGVNDSYSKYHVNYTYGISYVNFDASYYFYCLSVKLELKRNIAHDEFGNFMDEDEVNNNIDKYISASFQIVLSKKIYHFAKGFSE